MRTTGEHAHIHIDRAVVERFETLKFLSVHTTKEISWSTQTQSRIMLHLFPLRMLKIFRMGPQILKKFYSCTTDSILTGCITTWYGNCLASDHKVLQSAVHMA